MTLRRELVWLSKIIGWCVCWKEHAFLRDMCDLFRILESLCSPELNLSDGDDFNRSPS